MAENNFSAQAEALFKGMNTLISTKTVVGEPQKVGDAVIIPLVDVSCGMAVGTLSGNSKDNGGGGLNTKISPAAVLIIQNGATKLVTVRNQDAISKAIDLVPDVINRFTASSRISPEADQTAKNMLKEDPEKAEKDSSTEET